MKANRKVIVSTFASNISRVQQVVNAAQKTNRKLALLGRSMVNVVAVAMELGYLTVPDGMLIDPHEINEMAPEKVAILCTGSQGEPYGCSCSPVHWKLSRCRILPEDTVIFAAGPIPGNERNVTIIVDNLFHLEPK